MTITELIAALEAATQPERDLDAQIAVCVRWKVLGNVKHWVHDWPAGLELGARDGTVRLAGYPSGEDWSVPEFTGSLDAALRLVPSGWTTANIGQNDDKTWWCELREGYATSYTRVVIAPKNYKADTPALAVCTAALKARVA